MPFNTPTIRYLLDLFGLVILLIGAVLHSWALDGAGIGLLVLAQVMGPPPGLAGALVSWARYTFAGSLLEPEDDYPYGRKPWDLADSAYVKRILTEQSGQYEFNFPTAPSYQPCAYRVTPCGRTTTIRAWEDCQ